MTFPLCVRAKYEQEQWNSEMISNLVLIRLQARLRPKERKPKLFRWEQRMYSLLSKRAAIAQQKVAVSAEARGSVAASVVSAQNCAQHGSAHLFVLLRRCGGIIVFHLSLVQLQKNCVFWVVTPCGSCKNRRFGGNAAKK
jgi:hypothetical protein